MLCNSLIINIIKCIISYVNNHKAIHLILFQNDSSRIALLKTCFTIETRENNPTFENRKIFWVVGYHYF